MFLTVTQGKGKLRPFVKRVHKMVVRADKKSKSYLGLVKTERIVRRQTQVW